MRTGANLNKFLSQLWKDHRILKFIFIIFASYLIVEEFYNFVVVKPTYTSTSKRKLSVMDFPEIIVCPEPSVDVNVVASKGYQGVKEYFMGFEDFGMPLMGWAGNKSENVTKVSEDISTLKTKEDCPTTNKTTDGFSFSNIWSKDNDYFEAIQFNFTKALYPHHKCCKVIPPKFREISPISGLQIISFSNVTFEMFMADPLTASYFDLHKTIMLGDKLVTGRNGYYNYKVQMKEYEHLEDDPEYPCIDYKVIGEYGKCIENEMVRQNSKFLNCTPPWMTDNKELWCGWKYGHSYALSVFEEMQKYLYFMNDISASDASPGNCLVPCKIKRYETKEIGYRQAKDGSEGMYILFEKEVKSTKSQWTIDTQTFISKIGGFIGISKNFMWLVIMFMSAVGFLMTKLNLYKCLNN